MGLIVFILATILIVIGTIRWCEKKVTSGGITCGMGLWDVSREEFDNLVNKRKFSVLNSRVAAPYLSQFFAGRVNGIDTCIFSISVGRYSPTLLGILLTATNLPFPNFSVRPKMFSQEVGDMLGIRGHHAYPETLINKYDISSEESGRLTALLTPEIVGFFLDCEGVSVEVCDGDLLVVPAFIINPQNYEPAVKRAHAIAGLLGMNVACKEGHPLSEIEPARP